MPRLISGNYYIWTIFQITNTTHTVFCLDMVRAFVNNLKEAFRKIRNIIDHKKRTEHTLVAMGPLSVGTWCGGAGEGVVVPGTGKGEVALLTDEGGDEELLVLLCWWCSIEFTKFCCCCLLLTTTVVVLETTTDWLVNGGGAGLLLLLLLLAGGGWWWWWWWWWIGGELPSGAWLTLPFSVLCAKKKYQSQYDNSDIKPIKNQEKISKPIIHIIFTSIWSTKIFFVY